MSNDPVNPIGLEFIVFDRGWPGRQALPESGDPRRGYGNPNRHEARACEGGDQASDERDGAEADAQQDGHLEDCPLFPPLAEGPLRCGRLEGGWSVGVVVGVRFGGLNCCMMISLCTSYIRDRTYLVFVRNTWYWTTLQVRTAGRLPGTTNRASHPIPVEAIAIRPGLACLQRLCVVRHLNIGIYRPRTYDVMRHVKACRETSYLYNRCPVLGTNYL